jgi:hypothetical protein
MGHLKILLDWVSPLFFPTAALVWTQCSVYRGRRQGLLQQLSGFVLQQVSGFVLQQVSGFVAAVVRMCQGDVTGAGRGP